MITDKKETKDLTTQEIKNIIVTIPTDTIVGFTGGEPTIRKDFLEIALYAKSTNHKVALQTNGTRFSDWEFAQGACNVIDYVLIAIHSHNPETHNSIVRAFARTARCLNSNGFRTSSQPNMHREQNLQCRGKGQDNSFARHP